MIIGGHEHEAFYSVQNGTHVVKTGMDANKISVTELFWSDEWDGDLRPPTVSVVLRDAAYYAPDPAVLQLITSLNQDNLILVEHVSTMQCIQYIYVAVLLYHYEYL